MLVVDAVVVGVEMRMEKGGEYKLEGASDEWHTGVRECARVGTIGERWALGRGIKLCSSRRLLRCGTAAEVQIRGCWAAHWQTERLALCQPRCEL
jgi:hypothetical protein